jgi:DNA polymerase-4
VRSRVGLPITVGVASTKFVAKVASTAAKPDGLLLVEAGNELAFLHPLPVEALWGVGAATARKLHACGLVTVGQVAALSEQTLVNLLGRASGRHLHALAHARDPRRVHPGRRRGSIGGQRAIGWRAHTAEEIDATLLALVERVTRRMRAAGRVGRTVTLRLRFVDSSRATRSHTLPRPTAHTWTILGVVRALFAASAPLIAERGLTLVGIAVSNLEDDWAIQLTLPLDAHDGLGLDAALDEIRERFGSTAITRAVLLGRDTGLTVPLLPD